MAKEEKKKQYFLRVSISKHDDAFIRFLNDRVQRVFANRIKAEVKALIELLQKGKDI